MRTRYLKNEDLIKYKGDITQCYLDNLQIMDSQSPLDFTKEEDIISYIYPLIDGLESAVMGIFDDNEEYLFGLIVYDGIRLTEDGNAAQLHLASCKEMWGSEFISVYEEELRVSMFNTLYCMIPSYCRSIISLIKKLGFKKTGYIPKALPYTNLKGKTKMYDELIYVYTK